MVARNIRKGQLAVDASELRGVVGSVEQIERALRRMSATADTSDETYPALQLRGPMGETLSTVHGDAERLLRRVRELAGQDA